MTKNEVMDVHSPRGTKVLFAFPKNGYSGDQEKAKKHLIEGQVYTIDHTIVHSWTTEVYIQEVPGVSFNSVHFTKAKA